MRKKLEDGASGRHIGCHLSAACNVSSIQILGVIRSSGVLHYVHIRDDETEQKKTLDSGRVVIEHSPSNWDVTNCILLFRSPNSSRLIDTSS